jgi:hypothetical protein
MRRKLRLWPLCSKRNLLTGRRRRRRCHSWYLFFNCLRVTFNAILFDFLVYLGAVKNGVWIDITGHTFSWILDYYSNTHAFLLEQRVSTVLLAAQDLLDVVENLSLLTKRQMTDHYHQVMSAIVVARKVSFHAHHVRN